MVKMKFLPYMVRTFFCQNGLNATLYRNGTASYDAFCFDGAGNVGWWISQKQGHGMMIVEVSENHQR